MKKWYPLILYALALLSCSATSSYGEMQSVERLPIQVSLLAVAPKIAVPTLCVTAHVLTLRTGPAVSYPPTTWLENGQELIQLSSVGNWLEVTAGQYQGWVNRKFVKDCP